MNLDIQPIPEPYDTYSESAEYSVEY